MFRDLSDLNNINEGETFWRFRRGRGRGRSLMFLVD
jgi:hypothetical protein